ncbi:MAG: pyridoxamine 5'-phosphate oxidase family protein [Polyangiaceae bacterium]
MAHGFAEIAFTERVKALQEQMGSRRSYARFEANPEPVNYSLGDLEREFISARDSFYMASVSETGWPYLQHRGGPAGFVKLLDEETLGFADFRGNRQYVSLGNLEGNDRVALFFMDYAQQVRLKVLGHARVVLPQEVELMQRLELPNYRAKVEHGIVVTVAAFDWNCPQHITERYTLEQVQALVAPLRARVQELEALVQARPK